jgi:hypothetical protein
MHPFQFDSDMSDASTTPVDLSHLGDLAPLQLVRQPAEPRDPWEIAIDVGYIPFTSAPLTIALSSDLMDVELQYVPIHRGRRSPAPDRSFPEGMCSRCSVHDRTPAEC